MFSSSSFDDTNASSSSVAVVGARRCYYFLSSSVARSRRGVQKTRRFGGQHFQRSFLPFFLSKSLSSLSLSLCVRGKNNNAVSLSLSLSIYLSLYSRGRVFDDDIFFNSANERSAHTHTGRRRRRRRFVRSLGTSSSRFRRLHADSLLSLLCVKKQKKSDESSNSNLSLSSFLSLPLFNLFRV